MEPLTTSLAFSTVIQLLCNYRQEVAGRKNAELTDFLTWLADHKFKEVKELITNSSDIQMQIQHLMQQDLSDITSKLDILNDTVVAIASRLDGFSELAHAVGAQSESLSDQSVAVLSKFVNSKSTKLGVFLDIDPTQCALFPEGLGFEVVDSRFLADDVAQIEAYDFIKFVEHNSNGNAFYALTRRGVSFIQKSEK